MNLYNIWRNSGINSHDQLALDIPFFQQDMRLPCGLLGKSPDNFRCSWLHISIFNQFYQFVQLPLVYGPRFRPTE